jgi:hypothetical protein
MISDRTLERVLPSSRAVALYGDIIRACIVATLLLLMATTLFYYSTLIGIVLTDLNLNDFGKFYYSSREYLAGRDMYGPTPATSIPLPDGTTRQFLNMNPPHFQLLMIPLAQLTPRTAFLVWWLLSLLCFWFSVRAVSQELDWRWTPSRLLWFSAGALLSAITGTVVATGQLTFLLLLPVTLAWIEARRGHWITAAALLGLLASIKPFLGIFGAYLLLTHRFGALTVMVSAVLLALVGGVAVVGSGPYERWLDTLAAVEWAWAPMNASFNGIVTRIFSASPFYTPLTHLERWITPMWAGAAGVVTTVTLLAVRRDEPCGSVDCAFAGLLLAAQLSSPLGWIYYSWLLLGPAMALLRVQAPLALRTRALLAAAAPGLFCPLFLTIAGASVTLTPLLWGSAYFWSTLFLWLAWFFEHRRSTALRRTKSVPINRSPSAR